MAVPMTETKPVLRKGQMSLFHLIIATLANVGPAQGIFFSIAFLAGTTGLASPFGMLLAAVAILTVGNTLTSFSREIPSAGSFVTFISRTFGAYTGITIAVTVSIGYIIAITPIIIEIGGWIQAVFQQNFNVNIPWQAITIVGTFVVAFLVVRGLKISSQWAAGLFFTEAAVLLLISCVIVFRGGANGLSLAPLLPTHLLGGFKSLGLAFPLLVFSFVGFENSGPLAEEAKNPKRNIPRAVFWAIIIVAFLYVFSSYAAIVGYGGNHLKTLAADAAPFNTLAKHYLGGFGIFLIDFIGFTSLFACTIAACNSQTRIIFHAGREGLIPRVFGRVNKKYGTPHVALLTYLFVALALILIIGWKMQPLTFYADMGSLGTIPIILMYLLGNIALPVYMWRHNRKEFNWWRHAIVPVVGMVVLIWSFWSLIQPGQPAPYNAFPYIVLGIVVFALLYSLWLGSRNKEVLDVAAQTLAE
ncbi:APC family permease [Alicyclobacillus sp. ALC3]|uniref:APC family permease n=1 Tax=Alicyclobacillus sp. ALC3 TaxID=2796143 RepID=UPI0023787EFC|nr:APC family permease [Alicyclobacillus sp. ALC3]WDL97767.1 APC family permease [Alicyclobacillus sp. ALC3]